MTESPTGAVHFVAGGVGAGKTTRAMELEREFGALRLSVDELLRVLFAADDMANASYEWVLERVERCEALAVTLAEQQLALGRSVVLDLGFLGREQRDRVRRACEERGLATRLHFVDVPREERWRRVQERNQQRGASFSLHVTREMFDFCEGLLDEPSAEERRG